MTRAQRTLVLASGIAALVACSSASREEFAKAEAAARAKVNQYCDARQKAIEALGVGEGGAP